MAAFSKGNYEQAYDEFSELLLTYSKDPLYKYYSGVCLVKLNRDINKALLLLEQALSGAAAVRTLPSDAIFYLGRAQQMSGEFEDAIESFNQYTNQSGRKAARELGVPGLIQQCNEKTGMISSSQIDTSDNKSDDVDAVPQDEPKQKSIDITQKPIENRSVEKELLPASYNTILEEALDFQFKSDSITAIVSKLRKDIDNVEVNQKANIESIISDNEKLATEFQRSADLKYTEAQAAMNKQPVITEKVSTIKEKEPKVIADTVKQEDSPVNKVEEKAPEIFEKIAPAVSQPVAVFKYFEVVSKPVSGSDDKIEINPVVPEGLIYRIQVAVFRNPVAPSYFKGIRPVYGFKVAGTDKTNYYAGMFRRSSDAHKALTTVKAKGFKDAFVIALFANKTVSADRAANLEKEWGSRPFAGTIGNISETPIDTIPPTLSFRIEVLRTLKPVKDDNLEGMIKISGNRGLDIQKLEDGNYVYLIGKFITFESAAEFADLLIRNGYREAKVAAWLGKKEIPVEIAKQLFDNLE